MTELPDLPPPPDFSPSPRVGGLQQAVAEGRRRRGRFLAGAGAGGALSAVLLVGLIATSPAEREDSLRVASPAPLPSSSPATSPTDLTTAAPQPLRQTRPREAEAPAPSGLPRPPGRVVLPPGQEASPAPASSPVPLAQRPAYREQTDENADGSAFCTPGRFASGGCSYGGGDNGPVVRRGTPVTAHVGGSCAGAQTVGEDVYVFDTGQETELVVRQGGREVFRFSSTVRYVEGPHERRLRPGRCLEWRQTWDGVTTAGDPVPAGTYQVELTRTTQRERFELDGRSEERPGTTDTHSFQVMLVD